ncbi:recombinase family protein [Allokutzneria sp. A3M-2-11 16]|uniref:recombinase family protein n=1 Tax=Allokutzneria sp. A3M-2-11 16 TaxID=2962043 RepID=UPI0020B8C770|nr:recombinase family protein [Allokutzneria sp. A3M-2-11 16]MCP3800185.1 recombinase family protein [Allokutzneria sp. A3M-2-11 16]
MMSDGEGGARIYTRVSKFELHQMSPQDQEAECRTLAAAHGRAVRKVYREEPGTSAYQEWVKRPEFDQLLSDVLPGEMVISYAVDRVTRRGMEQAGAVLRVLDDADACLVTVADGIDSRRDDAELNIGLRAIMARGESKNTSTRSRRGIARRRAEGKWLWHRAVYGLRVVDQHLRHDPETYPYARRMADLMLSEHSGYDVMKLFNGEGIASARGGLWTTASVLRIVTNPAWAGVAIVRKRLKGGKYFYRPMILGEEMDDENDFKSPTFVGDGVVTLEEHRRIVALVEARSQERGMKRMDARFARSGRRVSKLLLGNGLGCCDSLADQGEVCGSNVMGTGKDKQDGGSASYTCERRARTAGVGGNSCAGMYMKRAIADAEVGERFINHLAACEPGDPLLDVIAERWTAHEKPAELAQRAAAEKTIGEVRKSIERAEDAFADGLIDKSGFARQKSRLEERLSAAIEIFKKTPVPTVDISPLLDPNLSRPAWEAASVPEKRALLRLAVKKVRLKPVEKRNQGWDPARIEIDWLA